MSAEIVSVVDGVLTVRIDGALTQPELAAMQAATAEHLRTHGKLAILVLAPRFGGWQRGGGADWGDVSFQVENDARIERMAIVGATKWKELALMFTAQGMRPFPIEYFADEAKARAWLAQ